MFLYSVHTDHAGHKHQWMSPEYITSIEEADVQIGKFLEEMKAKGLHKDTHFMFLTDHGGVTTDEIQPLAWTGEVPQSIFK